ncbi:MAG: hypothetical protein KBS81_08200 [Spirochaetales bacterium]|nr:hypothetical protein [Candidatus Physcosoma equi]
MGIYILLILSIALASLVQSTIGFGAAILMMNIITFFLDVNLTMVIC